MGATMARRRIKRKLEKEKESVKTDDKKQKGKKRKE